MEEKISTYVVNGFIDAGKTTYIEDCLKNDYFYKREHGKTLLICLEEGEKEYDLHFLTSRKTDLVIYPHHADIGTFILDSIDLYHPDRIYIESNAMIPELFKQLPDRLRIDFVITLIEGTTFELYYINMRQLLQNMIIESNQVIFNRCDKEILSKYGNIFRVMNHQAIYLWEGPTGYHEKAFGVMVPFDLDKKEIVLKEEDYVPFYLDALEKPDHYQNKILKFICRISMDQNNQLFKVGRQVMTCCMADIQFLSFECTSKITDYTNNHNWILLTCKGSIIEKNYHPTLQLEMIDMQLIQPPEHLVIGL